MRTIQYLYPNGGKRAVTFSYDDGNDYDRRLVETFNRYGLKATFHLNTSALGRPGCIRPDEAASLYAGHEIAAHSVDHPFLSMQPPEAALPQLLEDRARLEELAGYPVRGFSYPFGDARGHAAALVKAAGFDYARTTESSGDVYWPDNFTRWNPSCHHDAFEVPLLKLANAAEWLPASLLYVWGHSYEFGRSGKWDYLEDMCGKISEIPYIWSATNVEVMDYIQAARSLRWSADGSMVFNPSRTEVRVEKDGETAAVKPGLNFV